jgi:hypothetical protein
MPTCATLGSGLVNDDLGANHNAPKPLGSDMGDRKGIGATTYGYAKLSRVPGKEGDGVSRPVPH